MLSRVYRRTVGWVNTRRYCWSKCRVSGRVCRRCNRRVGRGVQSWHDRRLKRRAGAGRHRWGDCGDYCGGARGRRWGTENHIRCSDISAGGRRSKDNIWSAITVEVTPIDRVPNTIHPFTSNYSKHRISVWIDFKIVRTDCRATIKPIHRSIPG